MAAALEPAPVHDVGVVALGEDAIVWKSSANTATPVRAALTCGSAAAIALSRYDRLIPADALANHAMLTAVRILSSGTRLVPLPKDSNSSE